MLGPKNRTPQTTLVSEESSARSTSDSGPPLTIVDATGELGPAHVVDGALAAATRR